ncbi:serine-protein kinase ATM [Dermacentor silvarum]|uniref:serine-protein kinase ATM n=1 Tax=Dermacentor silvarum TaxID=543639 RepID=UPI002100AF5C|nr:serine-protein kinase ATM [Dermacentor silvarum]
MGGSYDLHSIVRNLRSNKITDRKRAFSALRSALKDQSILASLDKNTLDKVSLTWDLVAGNIAKVIEQELNKSTGHGKSRVAGPDVLAAVMLLRTVVQLANRSRNKCRGRAGQSLLNPRKMLEHVQRVLAGGPWEQQLQVQYTRLLRLLLLLDGWQATLPPSLYHGLVEGVCQLLRSDKEDTDVVALSSTLHHLVTLGFYQEDACLETVLRTLAGSFAKIRETGTASQVVLQLSSLVEVGRRLGARRRRLLCTLGEPLVRTLLLLGTWNSPQIKVLSLEFLALQLSLHRTSDADQSGWQCLLRDWHHLLMQQLQEASVLNQQELRVRRAQVWLAAETLHQLEPSGTALHTAVAALVAAKSLGRDVLPRLEVLACYLWKYPETAGHMLPSLQKLLEFLTQCYSSSKLLDVKRCVLRCYHGVAHALVAGQRPPWPLWNVVWEQTAKTVFLNQCVEEGHLVLQELLRKQLAACSDLGSLFCPGRPLEPSALRSLCVTLCQATHVDALLPEKHRWRLWLLELPATVQLGSALVMGAELLAALCLARPATALASQYSPPQVWQDPYPWRAILDADLERRTTAVPRTESGAKDTGSWHKSPVTVVETAWEATLDTLAKQGLAFLDSIETLPACLCSGAMGAILLTHMWRLQVRPALFDSPLVQQLQSCLRDCTEKLVHQQQCWKDAAWLCLLEALLSYVEGGPAPACAWLLGALPQELDDCLLTTLRATPDCIGDDIGVRPHGDVTEGCHVDSDEWADDSLPSSSVASSQGSSGDDFEFADTGQPVCYDMAATVLSPDRLTQEETQQLAVLRIALSYFCLGRRAAAAAGGALDLLLQLLEEAARGLSAWSIQAALQVLRMLLERAELLNEAELFSLVDALRELMKVHCRQLDVSAALLELARLCVPALNRRVAGTELRHCFLVVLDAYTALLSQGILNEAVSLAFLRLLLECLQEPSSSWVRLTVDGQPVSVLQYTLRFLGSSHDSVRTLAAENMAVFLRGQQPASLQALLPLLYKHLEADVSREDEHHSGCLVFATALANAAIALGPHLGGTATALVLQAVRDRGLPDTLAAKVLGFAHADPWAEVHLPAVVYHWLRRGLPLAELPVSALGCSSATQFWKCHWVRVLPAVVECCHSRAVQLVSDSVSIPARELLRQVAPSVLSRALPSSEPLRFLQEHLSPEVVEQVFVDHLPEVLVSVLQLACDLPTHATPHDDQYPPCLGEGQVQECLQLLERKCCGDLLAVLLRKRDGVQLVLEGLQQCAGPRLAALKHLVAMVSLALARPTGLGGSECFVLRTLTRQLLRKLPVQGGADDTVRLVARLLRQLYEASLVYKEAARNLPLIINALAPFVDDKNTAVEVQRLVQILLSDEKLEAAAMLVLPRCCHGSLDAVQLRLKQGLVTQVLAVFTQSLKQDLLSGHEDIGTLVALGSLLKERRADLLMDMQGKLFFTEAASSSPLHQLVVVLFQQARSPHRQVREASLHCLGILGPIEWHLPCLSTAHWNPISGMVDEPTKGCRHISYAIIFRTMERYLSHPDAKLSRVACQVLKCALATPAGFSFASQHGQAEDMEDTFAFLHPFVPSQCKASLVLYYIYGYHDRHSPQDFLEKYLEYCDIAGIPPDRHVQLLPAALEGSAKQWWHFSARLTSFKESVLEEVDSNGDIVKSWCQRGLKSFEAKKQQKVVIEHLESFNLGRATADIIIDCVERSITELPKEKLLCFFSDGPNTMKSVKKLKDAVHRNILDIGECNLHKILPCLVTVEETVKSIKYVVASVPHMINGKQVSPLERPLSATDLSRLELWAPEEACDHATWITNLVCTLIRCCNDHILWALLPLCSMAVDLCELLFPLVVETLSDEGSYWSAVVSGMAIFLDHHAEAQVKDEAQRSQSTVVSEPMSTELTSGLVYCCQSSVAVMMSAVERMVVRRDAKARTLWEGLRLGCVNFLRAAQAAEFCGHHVTAVQCVELWWDSLARPCDDGGAPFLHWSAAEAAPVQSVLLSSLSGLGDLDALTGCRCLALGGPAHLLLWRHWAEQQGGHWPTLLAQADLAATGRNARLGHALKQCGLYHTLAAYLEPSTPDLAELQAECAWRLANWDCQLSHDDHGCGHMGLHRGIFMTLSSMSSQDTEELCSGLKACRELLSSRFSAMTQLGSTLQLNQLLAKMQMCTVLEECAALLCGNEDEAVLLARWEQRAAQPAVHFDVAEPVLWLQSVVLGQLHSLQADAARTSILRHYAVHARINQRLALARVALQQLECCAPDQASRWLLEEARIQLAHGDCTEAQHTLWTLLRQLSQQHEMCNAQETGGVTRAYAEVLQLYGECLAESHLESSDTIAREYLDKAVQLLSGRAEDALWAAHLRLAQFADSQLQSMEQYLHSPEFRAKQELLQQSSHILDCTQSSGKRTSIEEARALRLLERQSNLDRGEAASLEAVRRRHLLQAIDNYLQCLRGGHSLRLFRLVSLWIANATAPEVNALLQQGLRKLESHKFVPLIYQLAARMSRPDGSTFPGLLFQLIERVVRDHPYQTLPVVLALCNADRDPTATIPRAAKKAKTSPTEDRVEGARYLVLQLRKGGGLCSSILGPLERLMDAYIHLAYLDPPGVPRGQTAVRLPRDTPLLKLGPMDRVPVLTQNVEVDHSASYCNLPGILRFSAEYRLCGGINKPKVITCVSQDGSEYKQLVKGRDDLRQDAVMQQAFGLVNCLLAHDPTATGRLAMRTYKVVPLSRRSGLVQWCEGTQPFSEFLLTPHTGAHQRYQPHDWTPVACRNAMQEVHKGSPEERLHVYQEVCSHFHPVFRYFFFEQFPEPSRWFERRRAYIHSVATGSIGKHTCLIASS